MEILSRMLIIQSFHADVNWGPAFAVFAVGTIVAFAVVIAAVIVVSMLVIRHIKNKKQNDNK